MRCHQPDNFENPTTTPADRRLAVRTKPDAKLKTEISKQRAVLEKEKKYLAL